MLSRVASINAGVPDSCLAMTLNRLCGSGVQAIVSVAQAMKLGEATLTIGAARRACPTCRT